MIKKATGKKLQAKKTRLFKKYKRFYKKKLKSQLVTAPKKQLLCALRNPTLSQIFTSTKKQLTKNSLLSSFTSISFFNKRTKHLVGIKKLRLLKVTKHKRKIKSRKLLIQRKKKSLPILKSKTIKTLGCRQRRIISSLNALSLLTPNVALKQTKKKLIAKYNRTCNIKTQKE